MARTPYEDEIVISWAELHRDTRFLSHMLHEKGPWKGIIAITRGGLVPAALIARELDIRLIDTICVTSYDSGTAGAAAQGAGGGDGRHQDDADRQQDGQTGAEFDAVQHGFPPPRVFLVRKGED